jgi:ATP adenylyltransferase
MDEAPYDHLQRLWAPWRMEYILAKKEQTCVFCKALERGNDRDAYILYRGQTAFVILNLYPYNNGHVMVLPYRHIATLSELTPEERAELMELAERSVRALEEVMHPEGFNVGINLGRAAGAGIETHLHMHVVPRWAGDTNFTTVIGSTRTLPELLSQTYERLHRAMADQP